ncbi:hypothetical protein HDU91_006671, partial [Kappamyces sp. JEL0680]
MEVQVTLVSLAVFASVVLLGYVSFALFRRQTVRLLESKWPDQPNEEPLDGVRDPSVVYIHIASLRPWGNPNASPYSLKLETWLRIAKIPHVIVRDFNLAKAPKGKIPWMEYDGQVMGDSELIIEFLSQRFGVMESISPEQVAMSHCITRMMSECTAACMGYARNVELVEETLKAYTGLSSLTWTLKLAASRIRKGTMAKLVARGLGVHSREEIYEMGLKDLHALAVLLGDSPFMMGDGPTRVDAS